MYVIKDLGQKPAENVDTMKQLLQVQLDSFSQSRGEGSVNRPKTSEDIQKEIQTLANSSKLPKDLGSGLNPDEALDPLKELDGMRGSLNQIVNVTEMGT